MTMPGGQGGEARATSSAAVAGLLSAFVPGIGQAYAGHPLRGLAWMSAPIAAVMLPALLASETSSTLLVAVSVLLGLAYLAQIADAVFVAKRAPRKPKPAIVAVVAVAGLMLVPTIAALTARGLVIEAFKIPSGSMTPTLRVGDHLFADKIVYRKRDPRRGEMAIFRHPENPSQSFVSRVIGLPGDTVEARGGHAFVNGWEVPSCHVGPFAYADVEDGSRHSGDLWVEFLEDEAYFVLLTDQTFGDEKQGPFTFDAYFVMGDNRHNAYDSRMWNQGQGGGVPAANLQGRARYRWLPSFGDYAGALVAPAPELASPLEKCLRERPPREKTTPPAKR